MNRYIMCWILFLVLTAVPCLALEPGEILVVANKNAAGSIGLAKYYMKKRGIPKENLIKLCVTDKETLNRLDYEKRVAVPVRRYLEKNDRQGSIRCLVIMYGLPLKVAPPELTAEEREEIEKLKEKKSELENRLHSLGEERDEERSGIKRELESIKKQIFHIMKNDQWSSLDSEIALVFEKDYPLSGWIPNPYYLGFRGKEFATKKESVLMVSRLDGPSDSIVRRIIDDSIETEKKGLKGTAYFDARWPDPGDKKNSGYAFYDASIHKAANLIKKMGIMPVVIDSNQELFQPGQCPQAALYCGWYRLSRYVDAFQWQPGAVGFHIASGECATLRGKSSRVWCKMMLEKGVAATIGPVDEPYVQAFPVPEIFFSFLVDGYFSLAECCLVSLPYLSWKMVLVGDPLYRPFKNRYRTPTNEFVH